MNKLLLIGLLLLPGCTHDKVTMRREWKINQDGSKELSILCCFTDNKCYVIHNSYVTSNE